MDLWLLFTTAVCVYLLAGATWVGLQGSTWLHRAILAFAVLGCAGTLLYVPVALEANAFFEGRAASFVGMNALDQYRTARFAPTLLAALCATGVLCWPGWGRRREAPDSGGPA